MYLQSKKIHITETSDLNLLLLEAKKTSLLLEKNGEVYLLTKEKKQANKKNVAAHTSFLSPLGSWDDVDADTMIEDMYRARTKGSRSDNRP